jgi:hypothetical protein
MVFVLTCALCAAQPVFPAGAFPGPVAFQLLEERLSLSVVDVAPVPPPSLTLALERMPYAGSGEGEDHSGHMGPMWIVMGGVMVVMMIGMGVYVMRNGAPVARLHPVAQSSPAQLALPVTDARGGGG